jgi:hypothetical protein
VLSGPDKLDVPVRKVEKGTIQSMLEKRKKKKQYVINCP